MGCPQRLLESETDAYLFFSDCNETDSVIKESVTLAKSKDFGKDKLTAMSLLQRHKHLQDKIQSIEGDVARVEENGQKLMNSQVEPKIVSVEVKKPVTVKDVRKVRIEREITAVQITQFCR